jgi:hypothetical protein
MSVNVEQKDPAEKITLTFPFARELNGATITPSSQVVTVALTGGTDANPNAVLNGAAQISGSNVLQGMKDGVNGCSYHFRGQVDLSDGRRLVRKITIEVTSE